MGLQPNYNQTVSLDGQGNVTLAELLRAIVPRDDIRETSAASASDLNTNYDIHPTSGRLAELIDGTLVIGDGSTWQDAQSFVQQVASGINYEQRGAPSTSELADGERMVYVSDGSDGNAAGDLVSARNNGGAIVDQVLAAASGDA